jgi:uncharacterized protein
MSETVIVTEAARDLIARLKTRYGTLMFVQSGGCCDGSSPVCMKEGELLLGPNDLLLGEIAGCPFYIDREQYERWRRPQFLIDVSQGEGDTFSLEGPEGVHFVARTMSQSEVKRRIPNGVEQGKRQRFR